MNNIITFMTGWFYYGFYYIVGGIFATVMLNIVFKKLYLPPLIVNAVSALLLVISFRYDLVKVEDRAFVMYFNYMPCVFGSILYNCTVALIRYIKNSHFR